MNEPRGSRRTAPLLLALLLFPALAAPLGAKVFLTQDEALRLAFPAGTEVVRRSAFLTAAELEEAKGAAGVPLASQLVTFHVGLRDGKEVGRVYFDTHVVRTLPETLLVLVDPSGAIGRIEVISFSEPEDYLPKGHWYAQFAGRKLDDELSTKRGVRPVAGATLTAKATTEAARRVLALDAVVRKAEARKAARGAGAGEKK